MGGLGLVFRIKTISLALNASACEHKMSVCELIKDNNTPVISNLELFFISFQICLLEWPKITQQRGLGCSSAVLFPGGRAIKKKKKIVIIKHKKDLNHAALTLSSCDTFGSNQSLALAGCYSLFVLTVAHMMLQHSYRGERASPETCRLVCLRT